MRTVRVLVSCPSDVKAEKEMVREICDEINEEYENELNTRIKVLDWERDVV